MSFPEAIEWLYQYFSTHHLNVFAIATFPLTSWMWEFCAFIGIVAGVQLFFKIKKGVFI